MDFEVPTRFDERDWERDVDGEPLRIAIVGVGGFARNTALPAIDESDHCEASALVSGSPEKAERVAEEHDVDVTLTYEAFAEGEAADTYDAVYVATPNALHLPHVEAAAELGKAVLCEKPLEATADRARRLVAACDAADVPLMTAYRMQTTRSVRWVRELVRGGAVGDPVRVDGEFSFQIGTDEPDQWRLDAELAGGGALMDIGVYPLNTARFVLDADPIALCATTRSTRPAFEGVDEHVTAQVEFPDDVTVAFSASFGAAAANRFAVLGREGRVVVEPIFGIDADRTVTIERDGGRTTVEVAEPNEVVEEFDYFAAAVLADVPIGPDGHHGLIDVVAAESVYESAENGRRVEL